MPPYTARSWGFALGCEGCVLAFSHPAILTWSSPEKHPGHLTVPWSPCLYHTWHVENFGRGAGWHSSVLSSCQHTFPCPLLPAAYGKHFWGGGLGDGALELFVWLPLYYDCSPFYKYYLNIMMRSKNKTKYWKMKAENPSSILLSPGAEEQNNSGFV